MRGLLGPIALLAALCSSTLVRASGPAEPDFHAQIVAKLAEAGLGVRFGLVAVDAQGREIIALAPDERFIPASNTKMFTTAAAYFRLSGLDQPDAAAGTRLSLAGRSTRPDVVLTGFGDARLSSAPDCRRNCLAALADTVATRTRRVNDIIGDASWFMDQRWSAGMSWNNIAERSGTGIAALSVDNNEILLRVTPVSPGQPPLLWLGSNYLSVDNRAVTGSPGSASTLDVERLPFEMVVRLTGSIPADSAEESVRLGIDDPAHFTAWRFAQLLRERGVKVKGTLQSIYATPGSKLIAPSMLPLAQLLPDPLAQDVMVINKVSQNLHSDLLLRRLGRASGNGSVGDGLLQVHTMLQAASVPRTAYDFADGSGMSTYNRISPRGTVRFLRWVVAQPWGAAWRASLPIGGVDGTIARRFKGTALEGKIFAKTGTLNATNALSGYLIAASGQEISFSFLANDVPDGVRAVPLMDAALLTLAAAH
jgi:serine-type D-Ala-D-Ala carboxypeptidase/endopeptidase (penicillin-binding protein 4)